MFKKIASTSFVTSAISLFCAAVSAQDFPVLDQIAAYGANGVYYRVVPAPERHTEPTNRRQQR
jgi:hypothetical protein